MYGKIFASMYDGTLRADWKAIVQNFGRSRPCGNGWNQKRADSPQRVGVANAHGSRRTKQRRPEPARAKLEASERCCWWESEPGMGRVAHGVSRRVDRLRGLGNAIVPQVAFEIMRAIQEAEGGHQQ